ncbi:MAG: hypothetical protein K2X76_05160 [Sphingomonas sp.]|nr:hypothetical protein [Sphingomonas sp.]
MSLFQKLMGTAAVTTTGAAAPTAPAAPAAPAPTASEQPGAPALTEDRIEAALQAAKAEGHAEGVAAGAQAERERAAAVFASEEGKANMTMAAWMLGAAPTATADQIVAQLKAAPAPAPAAAAPAAPAPAAQASQLQQQLATTPRVDLNAGKPAANANDGGHGAGDIWADIHKGRDTKAIRTGN